LNRAKRSPGETKQQRDIAERRLHVACRAYKRQYDCGRLFLHEHPHGADSWTDEEMEALAKLPGVHRVKGPMCH